MRLAKLALPLLTLALFLPATAKTRRGVVKPDSASRNEGVMTAELKALLAANPRPRLVIRVPNPPALPAEAEKLNAGIAWIEKALLQNGFLVRDRALLESLIRSGASDFQAIGARLDTDLILDVLSLQFDLANRVTRFQDRATGKQETFLYPDNWVDCPMARLECRAIIVATGQLGGMFAFHASRCDLQDLEFLVDLKRGILNWANSPGGQGYRSLSAPLGSDEARSFFATYLAHNLMAKFLEEANARQAKAKELYDSGRFEEAQPIIADMLARDPRNFLLHAFQALLDARRGDFPASFQRLQESMSLAMAPYQQTVVRFARARVYALQGEKEQALLELRQALEAGLVGLVGLAEVKNTNDFVSLSSTPEFAALIAKHGK